MVAAAGSNIFPPTPMRQLSVAPDDIESIQDLTAEIEDLLKRIPDITLPLPDGRTLLTMPFESQRLVGKLHKALDKLQQGPCSGVLRRQKGVRIGSVLRKDCLRVHRILTNYRNVANEFISSLTKLSLLQGDHRAVLEGCQDILSGCVEQTNRLSSVLSEEIPVVKRRSKLRLCVQIGLGAITVATLLLGASLFGVLGAPIVGPISLCTLVASLGYGFWSLWRDRESGTWEKLESAVKAFGEECDQTEKKIMLKIATGLMAGHRDLSQQIDQLKEGQKQIKEWQRTVGENLRMHDGERIDHMKSHRDTLTQLGQEVASLKAGVDHINSTNIQLQKDVANLNEGVRSIITALGPLRGDASSLHPYRMKTVTSPEERSPGGHTQIVEAEVHGTAQETATAKQRHRSAPQYLYHQFSTPL